MPSARRCRQEPIGVPQGQVLDAGGKQVVGRLDLELGIGRNDDHQAVAQQVLPSHNLVLLGQIIGPFRVGGDQQIGLGAVDDLLGQRGRSRIARLDDDARSPW